MKRFITLMLLALLVAPMVIAQSQPDIIIGVVTYQLDGQVWAPHLYTNPINGDLQVLPLPEGVATSRDVPDVEPQHFLVDIRDASTAAEQIAAIDALLAAGVQGLVISPVDDFGLITDTIRSAANQVPVVLQGRNIPELGLPFAGMDMDELGKALAEQQDGGRFVLIGNASDATQSAIINPLMALDAFGGIYEAVGDGSAETAQAIAEETEPIEYVLVTHHRYADGAASAIVAATAGSDRLIELGSVWAPDNWKELFDQRVLHGVFAWDNYATLMQATVMAKVMIRDGVTPENFYPDVLYYSRSNSYNHTSHPYSLDTPNRLGRFW